MSSAGVPVEAANIAALLVTRGSRTTDDIAEALGIDGAVCVRALNWLHAHRFVERRTVGVPPNGSLRLFSMAVPECRAAA